MRISQVNDDRDSLHLVYFIGLPNNDIKKHFR